MNYTTPENNLAYFAEHHNRSATYMMSVGETSDKKWWEDQTPHLMVIGGTHGNEPAGVEAIIRIHEHLQREEIRLSGKVTFVLGNPQAYELQERYLEKDLNRAFTKEISPDTIEGRRALELRNFLQLEDVSSVLDLHSVSKGDFKMVAYSGENSRNRDLAQKVSSIPLHFRYHSEHLAGTLLDEAESYRIVGIGVECGNHSASDAINTAVEHIALFLLYHKLIQQGDMPREFFGKKPNGTLRCYETIQAIKPGRGFHFLDPKVVSEAPLKKGEAFAEDDEVGLHRAPQDCYVMMPSKTIKHTDTDAGFLCVRHEEERR